MAENVPDQQDAPGTPGIEPRWTSSKKSGVGTPLSPVSRVWFTLSHGILNEIFYPRVDIAAVRDMGLIVTDGGDFRSEEKRAATSDGRVLAEGVPGYHLVNTCRQGRYRITKQIIANPQRDALLQHTLFEPLQGQLSDYHLYALISPHLYNKGAGNDAWVGSYKGIPMLLASRDAFAMALACTAPWLRRSAGFVGASDGWTDVMQHGVMQWTYGQAENGNTALIGEIDLAACGGEFVLSLGFGSNSVEAGNRARASLQDGFDEARQLYVSEWTEWQRGLRSFTPAGDQADDVLRISMAVLKTHESKVFPGGIIASLSVPWGQARGDDDLGGYHLAWPRDQTEAAGALLAAGATEDLRRVLYYLQSTQEEDGHWPQNMWLDGWSYWQGIQMDETALPVLLVYTGWREGVLEAGDLQRLWEMVEGAARYLLRNGPVTQQDRWEEDSGYTPFTLATEIAALLAAAKLAESLGLGDRGAYLRETADYWNENIERWTYRHGGQLAEAVGVGGYYVRSTAPSEDEGVPSADAPPHSGRRTDEIVSPDALALVRFGLREAKDPRIVSTVKVIDDQLRVQTPYGPAWRRYNGDEYGEYDDGRPYDGSGVGRAWPLLTGERAHYELAAGETERARELLGVMAAFASDGGMIPEQVWDAEDLPDFELHCGRPSGSAMPLVWAHAEYVKLLRSLQDGVIFDQPDCVVRRYLHEHHPSACSVWRFNQKIRVAPVGRVLRVEALAPAVVHWGLNEWTEPRDAETHDTGWGIHLADLPVADESEGATIVFTFHWLQTDRWEGRDFSVRLITRDEHEKGCHACD